MPIYQNEVVTPRETIQHDWELDAWNKQAAHDLKIHQLKLESVKAELKLRQEERLASRKHQEHMKELELEIRRYETQWGQILRLPVMIIRLPLYILFGVALCIATARNKTIDNREFWTFLK